MFSLDLTSGAATMLIFDTAMRIAEITSSKKFLVPPWEQGRTFHIMEKS